jgi:hypothetical protein
MVITLIKMPIDSKTVLGALDALSQSVFMTVEQSG